MGGSAAPAGTHLAPHTASLQLWVLLVPVPAARPWILKGEPLDEGPHCREEPRDEAEEPLMLLF